MTLIKGIDISRWQGSKIDFNLVREAGYKFVFIKVTEGIGYKQQIIDQAREQAKAAKAAKLKIGYYHFGKPFGKPAEDGTNEAKEFLDKVASFPKANFPHVLDFEDPKNLLNRKDSTTWVKNFLATVQAASGSAMFYSYKSYADSKLNPVFGEYPLWIAAYPARVSFQTTPPSSTDPANGWDKWEIWQYSEKGVVPGIKGNVDLNVMEEEFYNKY